MLGEPSFICQRRGSIPAEPSEVGEGRATSTTEQRLR